MNISDFGVETGIAVAGAAVGWLAEYVRQKRKRKADEAAAKRVALRLMVLAFIPALVGCATVGDAILATDARMNPPPPPLPVGYAVAWDVYDANHQPVDIAGYYKLPRLKPIDGALIPANRLTPGDFVDPNAATTEAIRKMYEASND